MNPCPPEACSSLRRNLAATALLSLAAVLCTPATADPRPAQAAPDPGHPITGRLQQFALNALLVPLLDDAVPPRWTEVALHHLCGPGTRVEVNGQPLVPAAPIPATAFTVRWHIDSCWPLGSRDIELSGSVELLVFHEDNGLSALVSAQRLRVSGVRGSAGVGLPFTATMSLMGSGSVTAP
jgi:hypothetical protein